MSNSHLNTLKLNRNKVLRVTSHVMKSVVYKFIVTQVLAHIKTQEFAKALAQ